MTKAASCVAAVLGAATLGFFAPGVASAAAVVGQPAPDFTLKDTGGASRNLADFKGKYVVLEWTNPDCPFVQKHYNSGNMPALQNKYTSAGVTWLTINSTALNHPEYKKPEQMAAFAKSHGAASTAFLLDPDGKVGTAYGAKTTPNMYVIDPQGKLIYAGAIDDKRSTDVADVKTAKNYVAVALDEAKAGKAITTASTSPYGCSVKYD